MFKGNLFTICKMAFYSIDVKVIPGPHTLCKLCSFLSRLKILIINLQFTIFEFEAYLLPIHMYYKLGITMPVLWCMVVLSLRTR